MSYLRNRCRELSDFMPRDYAGEDSIRIKPVYVDNVEHNPVARLKYSCIRVARKEERERKRLEELENA